MQDEITGQPMQPQKYWVPADGPNVPFSHHIVSKTTVAGVGTSYAIGSLNECRQMQLERGLRAVTDIVPF